MDLIDESKGIDWLDGFKKTNKQKNNIWCLPASHFSFEVTHGLKVKRWKRYSMQLETTRVQGYLY